MQPADVEPTRGIGRVWSWFILIGWLALGPIGLWYEGFQHVVGATAWVILTALLYYWQGYLESKYKKPEKSGADPTVVVVKKMAEIPPQDSSGSDS